MGYKFAATLGVGLGLVTIGRADLDPKNFDVPAKPPVRLGLPSARHL